MSFLSNVRNLIQGTYHYLLDQWDASPIHIKEQATLRASLCQDCLAEGRCLSCGCSTPGMFFAPAKECPKQKWGAMLPPEEWETQKLLRASRSEYGDISTTPNYDKLLANERGHIQTAAGPQSTVSQPDFDPAMSSSSIYWPEEQTVPLPPGAEAAADKV